MTYKEKKSVEAVKLLKEMNPADRKELKFELLDKYVGDLNMIRYLDCLFSMAERG